MFLKFYIALLFCLVLTAHPAWSSAQADKLEDFLMSTEVIDHGRPSIKKMFKGIPFPGTTQTLFNDLTHEITTLRSTNTSQFPYEESEMLRRFTLLKQNLLRTPPSSEAEMQTRLSYFALMHLPQIESRTPSLAAQLKRIEKEIAFSVFPTKKEVLWLLPETYLNGQARVAFSEFLDLLFERFDYVKESVGVTTLDQEKEFIEKIRLKQVNREELTGIGWPAHSPASIVIGWFCLYDRLKSATNESEQYEALAGTINLHETALKKMSKIHAEKLPAFMCDACKGTALFMNGIEPGQEEKHKPEPCKVEDETEEDDSQQ
jgi:hypothetical protein